MIYTVCLVRPAPVSGRSERCAECRRDVRRENEALGRAIWGGVWKARATAEPSRHA